MVDLESCVREAKSLNVNPRGMAEDARIKIARGPETLLGVRVVRDGMVRAVRG